VCSRFGLKGEEPLLFGSFVYGLSLFFIKSCTIIRVLVLIKRKELGQYLVWGLRNRVYTVWVKTYNYGGFEFHLITLVIFNSHKEKHSC
jgi:hypothetical protein